MKKIKLNHVPIIMVTTILMFGSCVSKKKYKSLTIRSERLQVDSSATHKKLDQCNLKADGLENEKTNLTNENAAIINELRDISATSKMTIADQARRLKTLQSLIEQQRNVLNKLKKSIGDALVNFNADEISVFIKDGNVYVSLEEKLLFKSGKADVDPKGKQALSKLAEVLKTTANIKVVIEGHTDSVPIKSLAYQDNWALSVARSTAMVRVLTKDYGVDSKRITASGRGEFYPVKSNDTEEGKASNRRTEIIISPDLNELFKLLEQ